MQILGVTGWKENSKTEVRVKKSGARQEENVLRVYTPNSYLGKFLLRRDESKSEFTTVQQRCSHFSGTKLHLKGLC